MPINYITADTHFGHNKDFIYEARGFKSINEHDEALIKQYNETVGPDDTCYFLGDFALRGKEDFKFYQKLLDRMNGTKILILGNHDKLKPFTYVEAGFRSVHTSLTVYGVTLIHDPSAAGVVTNEQFICGHVHNLFRINEGRVINVGYDVWRRFPTIPEVLFELYHSGNNS